MNKRQLNVQKVSADNEAKVLRQLKQVYNQASKDCEAKIRELSMRDDMNNLSSIIYQKQYQEALKKQIDGVLDDLNTKSFTTIAEYLTSSYEESFFGTLYDLQGQGVPLLFPMNQDEIIRAIQVDSKISNGLYQRLGEDTDYLKKSIKAELSRGIAIGASWNAIALHIANGMNSPFNKAYNNSIRIARTEGHRVQQASTFDCQLHAKSRGADIIKQWDSTLDGKTRSTHIELDGQIRELEEPFEVAGMKAMYPSDFGIASEDVNCRCCLVGIPRWALDEVEFTKMNGETGELVKLDEIDYNEFKKKAKEITQANEHSPDTLAGVKRGTPMTFKEANEGRANPNYSNGGGYRINCQSCVVTNEARRRGFDVETLPNTKGSMLSKVSRATNMAWIDPKTNEYPAYIFDDSIKTAKQCYSFLEKTIEQDKRYTFQFAWKGRGNDGHIICVDRTDKGDLRFYDPQTSDLYMGNHIKDYLKDLKYQTSVYGLKVPLPPKVLRIDDKQFNVEVVEQILKGAK